MTSEQESFSILGLAWDARPEAAEARYSELIAFLRSTEIPLTLQAWAADQAARVDEAYARLLDGPQDDAPAAASAAAPAKKAASSRLAARDSQEPSRVSWRPGKQFLVGVGVVLLVAIGIGVSRLDRGDSPDSGSVTKAASQDPNAPVPLDTARIAQWMKSVQENPSNTEALFSLGESYFQAQQWQISIDWFTKLVAADPKNVHAIADIGTANFNLGRFDAARASWQSGIQIAPSDPQLHYNLGFLAANTEPPDYATARREWQAVIDSAPESDLAKTVKIHMSSLPTQ